MVFCIISQTLTVQKYGKLISLKNVTYKFIISNTQEMLSIQQLQHSYLLL